MINVIANKDHSSTLLSSAKEIVKRFHRYNATDYDYNKNFNFFVKYNAINKSFEIYDLKILKLINSLQFPYGLNPDKEKLTFEMGDEVQFSVCNNLLIITTVLVCEDCVFPKIVYTIPDLELVNFLFPECNELILYDNKIFSFRYDHLSRYSNLPFLPVEEIEREISFASYDVYEICSNKDTEVISQNWLK